MRSHALLELRRTDRTAHVVRQLAWAAAGAERVPGSSAVAGSARRAAHLRWKRVADVLLSVALLPLVVPLLLVCAAAVKVGSPGPALVSQTRTGMGGRRFRVWRLRTTAVGAGVDGPAPRIGPMLRTSHLDALPELFSVLLGDMSLVGPRPSSSAVEALPLWYTGRLEAKPGITGLAQISSRTARDPDEGVRLDIAYVRTWTIELDARILARSATIAIGSGAELLLRAARDAWTSRDALAWPLPSWRARPATWTLPVPRLAVAGLVAADVAAAGLALRLAYGLRFDLQLGSGVPVAAPPALEYGKLFVLTAGAIAVVAWLQQLYRVDPPHTRLEETAVVARAVTLATVFSLAATFFYREFHFSRLAVAYFWVTATVLIATTHALVRGWLIGRRARGLDLSRTVVVGSPSVHLLDRLQRDPAFGLDLVGWLGPDGQRGAETLEATGGRAGVLLRSAKVEETVAAAHLPRLGGIEEAAGVLACCGAERVVIVEHGLTHAQLLVTIDACERHGILVHLVPPIYDLLIDPTDLTCINGVPVLRVDEVRSRVTQDAVKRLLDMVGSALLLVLLAPLFLGIAVAIRRTSPGPVLFRQVRGGRHGRPFQMLKFRTMVCDAEKRLEAMVDVARLDQPVFKLVDDPRVTPVGRWLRRFSLDELPQLLNVFEGDMSLVGPRPEELRLVERYDVWQRRRLKLKPGITGLQQIVARGHLSDLTERVRLDMYYARKQSLLLDLVILLRTVGTVLSGRGAT